MGRNLRIAFTLEAAWHPIPGGTGRVAIELARALDHRDDTDVVGVAALHRGPPGPDWSVPVSVRHHRLPRALLYELWSRGPLPRLRSHDRADIVHSSTLIPPPSGAAPLVVNVHDLAFRRHPDRFPARARRLYERSWRRVLERADAVLCPSAATSADLRAAGLDADRLHLVPLGHDPVDVAEDSVAAVIERFQLDGPFVLAAGTIEPRKNLPALISAFERVASSSDARLVLAGPTGWGAGPAELIEDLAPAVRERIVLTGELRTAELAALYRAATVFCYPSLLEGFGLPVLEAMSYGTPVLTSEGTATEEVAGGAARTVDPGRPEDIGRALVEILDDDALRHELAEAGLKRAASMTWDSVAASTRAVYDALL